ncbi:heme-binding protein [Thalassoroseus pseudoceratinae]|uniref:heme-binding protein n=1 Tax=Thalassoroseus pseudoceratinae TaxID=2713176 RepID=UPI00141F533E|nr:heme-binding protein [Thalassoroseus pseudoceratinae]
MKYLLLTACLALATNVVVAADQKPAEVDAPLPEGWPEPTQPGVIEVKEIPAYRSAIATTEGDANRADSKLFWQLFTHIKVNQIAMTAPVISTYPTDEEADRPARMEFLYRRLSQGEAGDGVGAVRVEDHPAETVVTLGIQGGVEQNIYEDGIAKLRAWLKDHPQWEATGTPRRLGYHGPMTPKAQRLWEVQIPIKPLKSEAK